MTEGIESAGGEATAPAETAPAPSTNTSGSESTLKDKLPTGNERGPDGARPTDEKTAKPKADKEEKPTAPRYKVRRGDKEEEHDGETLAKMLSEDYEHEFTGPGGKQVKLSWPEIQKRIALAEGAHARMQRMAEAERSWGAQREAGKKDPVAYLEGVLGIEDAESWALQLAQERWQEQQQIDQLMTSQNIEDRLRAQQMIAARVQRVQSRRDQIAKQVQQQEQQRREQAASVERATGELKEAFQRSNAPWSTETREIGARIVQEYAQADVHLKPEDLAPMVAREWRSSRRAELAKLSPEQLIGLLGDDLRARLREFEVAAAKGAKAAAKQEAAPAAEKPTNGKADKPKGLSESEYLRRQRGY